MQQTPHFLAPSPRCLCGVGKGKSSFRGGGHLQTEAMALQVKGTVQRKFHTAIHFCDDKIEKCIDTGFVRRDNRVGCPFTY